MCKNCLKNGSAGDDDDASALRVQLITYSLAGQWKT